MAFCIVFGLWIAFSIWWGYVCFTADYRDMM